VKGEDGLPSLNAEQVRCAVSHLGLRVEHVDEGLLRAVMQAWLRASPFHNLDLLAGEAGVSAPVGAIEAVDRALSWRGGPCHVQAAGFACLLRGIGYDVCLLPGTVSEPGDHLLVGVDFGDRRFVCDVGNGHPYPEPFPLARPWSGSNLGWNFRTTPVPDGLVLERKMTDGRWKTVYGVQWAPRHYDEFAAIIASHHSQPGFGPFLNGLRAVRITDHVMLSLRDGRYERHAPYGSRVRPVRNVAAAAHLLRGPLGLSGAPVDEALKALLQRRPDAFADAPKERPRILVSLSTTDRPASLGRLLEGIAAVARGDDGLDVLVVENSISAENRARNIEAVERARQAGLPITHVDDGQHGRSIARSRDRQTEEIARRGDARAAPDIVWMIDDDLVVAAREFDGRVLSDRALSGVLDQLRSVRDERPDLSMVLGQVTGDPPIRPEATLRTQAFDAAENIAALSRLDPAAPYVCAEAGVLEMPDYYYDHSRAGVEHLTTPCPWIPRLQGRTVRDETLAYARALQAMEHGHQATRPVVLSTGRSLTIGAVTSTALRGGNAAFFDFDALLAHPYPTASLGGTDTRRSDMIGGTLLARTGVALVATSTLSLLHERGSECGPSADQMVHWRSLRAEFHGVLLARLAMDPPSGEAPRAYLGELARLRATTIIDALREARRQIGRIDEAVRAASAWWTSDQEVARELQKAQRAVLALWEAIVGPPVGADPEPRLAALAERFLAPADLDAVLSAHGTLEGCVERAFRVRAALVSGDAA